MKCQHKYKPEWYNQWTGCWKCYVCEKCGFPFGFPAAFVWWQKGYKGETKITTLDKGGDNE